MSTLKVPKTIKILHKTYDVIERTNPTEMLNHPVYGTSNAVLNKIEWLRHEKESENVDTVIHEILHSIWNVFGLTDKDREEEIVTRLSLGLTTVMGDNKKLFQALLDAL